MCDKSLSLGVSFSSFSYFHKMKRKFSNGDKKKPFKKRFKPSTVRLRVQSPLLQDIETHRIDSCLDLTTIADKSAVDSVWTGTELDPSPTGAAGNQIDLPSQGSGSSSRRGKRCLVKGIRIRGILRVATQSTQTTLDRPGIVRLVLYKDMQTNFAQAQGEDVLGPGVGVLGTTNVTLSDCAVMAFMEPKNFGRFRILKDKMIRIPQPQAAGLATIEQGGYEIPFKMNVKLNDIVNFHESALGANDVTEVSDVSYHLIGARSGTIDVSISYIARLTFMP